MQWRHLTKSINHFVPCYKAISILFFRFRKRDSDKSKNLIYFSLTGEHGTTISRNFIQIAKESINSSTFAYPYWQICSHVLQWQQHQAQSVQNGAEVHHIIHLLVTTFYIIQMMHGCKWNIQICCPKVDMSSRGRSPSDDISTEGQHI